MPFKSEAQRRYLWANEPEIARDWTDTYGSKIQKAQGGRIGFALGSGELNRMAMEMFGKELRLLSEDEMGQLRYEWEMKKGMIEENYGDPYAKGGRIGYYTGGQSIPSEYTVEDARKTAMQDKLGGITDIMKKADLYRQGDIGQMYMADGGITRLGFYMGGASPDEGHANDPGHGANAPGDDHSYKTHHPNIHAGMKSPNVITPSGDNSSRALQNIDKGLTAINLLNFVKNPSVLGAIRTMSGPFGMILGAYPMMNNIYDDDEEQTPYNMEGLASLWQR